MPRKVFRLLEVGDIARLAAELRPEDRAEIDAAYGADHRSAIAESVLASSHVWVCDVDKEMACIFGVCPASLLTGTGRPWMLGTPVLDRYPLSFVKGVRRYIQRMLDMYPHLENWVDARNARHIALLRRLKFQIHDAEPFGVARFPFHRFELRAV